MSSWIVGMPIGVVNQTAWLQLRAEIWKNAVNREHRMADPEIRAMPWIAEGRPPYSWSEFAEGLQLTMSELGYLYQRQYKYAYLVAIAYGVEVEETGLGRVYRTPRCPEIHMYKLGPGRSRYAAWAPAPIKVGLLAW